MENSFMEYRDESKAGSDSDSEIIDNSLVVEDYFTPRKKPGPKNQTVFVAESEDSSTDDERQSSKKSAPKVHLKKSSASKTKTHTVGSSDDDGTRHSSARSQMEMSFNKVVLSSSSDDEEPQVSPELVPRRPPLFASPIPKPSPDTSVIGRKKNKRMMNLDSDTDNSIIIERNRNNKLKCLKDTPLKVETDRKALQNDSIMSEDLNKTDDDQSDDHQSDSNQSDDDEEIESDGPVLTRSHKSKKTKKHIIDSSEESDDDVAEKSDEQKSDAKDSRKANIDKRGSIGDHSDAVDNSDAGDESDAVDEEESDAVENSDAGDQSDPDEGPDADQMVLSRATRMSIMGIIPKDNESDESDFIESDEVCTSSIYEGDRSDAVHNSDAGDKSDAVDNGDAGDQSDPDEGPDADQMVLSRATRMSIMGIIPKDNESDESDFIESDEKSGASSTVDSLSELPEAGISIHRASDKTEVDGDSSHLSCSPFTSPQHNNTNEFNDLKTGRTYEKKSIGQKVSIEKQDSFSSPIIGQKTVKTYGNKSMEKHNNVSIDKQDNFKTPINVQRTVKTNGNKSIEKHNNVSIEKLESSRTKEIELKQKVLNNLKVRNFKTEDDHNDDDDDEVTFIGSVEAPVGFGGRKDDDDVTIIETKTEVIALSSDDDEEKDKKPIVRRVTSVKTEKENVPPQGTQSSGTVSGGKGTLKQYLVPPSYPNQQVVYVKKAVRQNELAKLETMREDLHNVKYLLEEMDINTLPDRGSRLVQRLTDLERQLREQGAKVANMVVADEAMAGPSHEPAPLSWDDLQKHSDAVQPRMFGKQAMATHMAERSLILERLRDLHESLASRPAETEKADQPKAVKTPLMGHQMHALKWLRWRETQRPCGGILADDMGLGKTITMLSLIVSDKDLNDDDDDDDGDDERARSKMARGGTLVVCPASLMQQWGGEVTKHCTPHALSVCLHHGANRAKHAHRLAAYDLVVTTYNILQRDNEKAGVLMKVQWRRIILDEAHIVRNHKSATSTAVSALRGKRRWCLTGTPVQNKDLDLFALLKFLRCTPFDDLTMWKKWIDNKSIGGQERMSTVMRCVLLRRTKQQLQQKGQLACLPERTAHLQEVSLSKEEMNVYQKVLVFSKTLFAQFLHQRAERSADNHLSPRAKNTAYDKMHRKMIALQGAKPVKSHEILVLLLRLRQVCCHCGLIAAMLDEETSAADEDLGGQDLLAELNKLTLEDKRRSQNKNREEEEEEKEESQPREEGTTAAEAIRSVLSPNNPVFELERQSSKIKAVMECLKKNVFSNKDDKAVVVSQWTSVLRLVEAELDRSKIKHVTLNGSVLVPARAPLIDKLNDPRSEVRVMLLSLCAGGVGLNLCGANHLLLLDPHWNPQLEEQAQDRIYRVGQTKAVHIYRFMCVDTVEQSIRKLQQAKLELAENVLTGARNTSASKLTIEDLKMLFNMGQSDSTQPQP